MKIKNYSHLNHIENLNKETARVSFGLLCSTKFLLCENFIKLNIIFNLNYNRE
jgi:hypothetical protein